MKKVSSLLSAIFLVGVLYAQNDTIPNGPNANQPSLGKDTVPGLRGDTTSWRRDTLNWNKDSLKGKWNDSLKTGEASNWNKTDSTSVTTETQTPPAQPPTPPVTDSSNLSNSNTTTTTTTTDNNSRQKKKVTRYFLSMYQSIFFMRFSYQWSVVSDQ